MFLIKHWQNIYGKKMLTYSFSTFRCNQPTQGPDGDKSTTGRNGDQPTPGPSGVQFRRIADDSDLNVLSAR